MSILTNEQVDTILKQVLHDIGNTIKDARTRHNLTMAKLAEKAGVSSSVISDLENYKNIPPNIQTLMRLANALELPEETFLKKIWVNITKQNAHRDMHATEKLRLALSEYGLPTVCMDRILDQIDYYISLNCLENNCTNINAIYESELENRTKMEDIVLSPALLSDIKRNIVLIREIKNRTFAPDKWNM